MNERQAEYNLEWAHQSLIDHQEALSLERERFEDHLLGDDEDFGKWAGRFIKSSSSGIDLQSFLDWCWYRHAPTLKPGWTQAWEERV
jgi:hypothetical protein